MELNKIIELANVLGLENEIETIEVTNDNEVEINGESYLVVDEGEREDIFREYQENLIDDIGLEGFTEQGREYIINNCLDTDFFKTVLNESNEFYVNDLEEEEKQELYQDNEVDNDGDLVEALNHNEPDAVKWYIYNFGIEDIADVIRENNLLDVDKIIDYIIEVDGYAPSLALYNGEELESDNYYIYRTN